jgi:hypothetical protein
MLMGTKVMRLDKDIYEQALLDKQNRQPART